MQLNKNVRHVLFYVMNYGAKVDGITMQGLLQIVFGREEHIVTEREFFEYLNPVLFLIFEVVAGVYGGLLYDLEEL
jgi:hypothetical protein